ncbi:unnamed protein product [Didymodactylos carnosus]|uniref:Uncharacterized protein n=1 Tax=Didymodactylos carnosus TaxID=1234261 RepID=A0A815KZ28_9BILA|nr:unnamed protein product [Didymodactylos carnosus]CAF4293583.1 unnamed protein product [Didymodactylos carnosus]
MTSRFLDVINEDGKILLPIEGYQNVDLLPLEQALLPVAHLFHPDSLRSNIWVAKQRSESPPNGLTTDESASIMLYTIEWTPDNHSLYYILNQTLRLHCYPTSAESSLTFENGSIRVDANNCYTLIRKYEVTES